MTSEADHEVALVRAQTNVGDIVIPASVTNENTRYTVTSIRKSAFSRSKVTSVIIPNSVSAIGERAFEDCKSLTSVSIPNSITDIEPYTFYGCESLTSVTIPNSVIHISSYAFCGCNSLTSVIIPNSVTYIGTQAFTGCKNLNTVTIDNSPAIINDSAFYGCENLTSISFGDSVTEIGELAFNYCNLTHVTIPNSVTSIGKYAFERCKSLRSVSIGNSKPNPNSDITINYSAFSNLENLTTVTLGYSVHFIGELAFYYCKNIKTFYNFNPTPPVAMVEAFGFVPRESVTVYIPKGSLEAYSALKSSWLNFDLREMENVEISLGEPYLSIEVGDSAELTASVSSDDDATIESESWSTSDPKIF